MRFVRIVFICFLLVVFLGYEGGTVLAMNMEFSTVPISPERSKSILENINLILLREGPDKQTISCFDVNEKGLIAIGCKASSTRKTVCIYTNTGDFLYGYSFVCDGSFGVELNGDIVNIYLVRGNIAISVDPDGNVLQVLEILDTTQNNDYWNNFVYLTKRKVGNTTYTIRNDIGILGMFATSYSQLTVTNPSGETHVVYDVNSTQMINMIISVIVIALLFILILVAIIRGIKKK